MNKENCQLPLQGCNEVIQPIQRSTFIKYNFASVFGSIGNEKYIALIGNKELFDALATEGESVALMPLTVKTKLNNMQISSKQYIFCGLKFKVTDFSAFDNNPVLTYLQGTQKKTVEIDLQKYMTEFAFKNNILTVPVKFLMDNRALLTWALPVPKDAAAEQTAVITMNINKVINEVYTL